MLGECPAPAASALREVLLRPDPPPGSTPIPFCSHSLPPQAVISSPKVPAPILPTSPAAFYNPNPKAPSAAAPGAPSVRPRELGQRKAWALGSFPNPLRLNPRSCSGLLAPWQSRRRDVRVFSWRSQDAAGSQRADNMTSISSPASEPAGRGAEGEGSLGSLGLFWGGKTQEGFYGEGPSGVTLVRAAFGDEDF